MKEDYYLTPDKLWIPLRWIAPELLEEYRGSLIVTDQTKTSNVWYVLKPSQPFTYSAAEKSALTNKAGYARLSGVCLSIHSVATLLGTSVKSNAIQYNSSAIDSAFTKTIMFCFD